MDNSLRIVSAITLISLSISCNLHRPPAEKLCTPAQAEQVGIEHGAKNLGPIRNIEDVCQPDIQLTISQHYLAGHKKGLEILIAERQAETCGYDQGYKLGMNHGQQGYTMAMRSFEICTDQTRQESERGYREGYALGIQNRPAPAVASTGQQTAQCSGVLGSTCVTTVGIVDSCYRGDSLEYRFFNPDRNLVFPSNKTVFESSGANQRSVHQVECTVGERICYGAASGRSYWGVGISGKEGCDGCCTACGSEQVWNIGC